jgi:hypothetical protein
MREHRLGIAAFDADRGFVEGFAEGHASHSSISVTCDYFFSKIKK